MVTWSSIYLVASLFQPARIFADAASTNGTIQLYSDNECADALNGSFSLAIDSCFGADDVLSIVSSSFPSCPSGRPTLFISDLEDCARPSIWPRISSSEVGKCLSFSTGAAIGSAAFICLGETTTASRKPVSTETSSTKLSSSLRSPQPENTAHSQFPGAREDGSDKADDIAMGVGIAFGLATFFIGCAALYFGWLSVIYSKLGVLFQKALLTHSTPVTAHTVEMEMLPAYREF